MVKLAQRLGKRSPTLPCSTEELFFRKKRGSQRRNFGGRYGFLGLCGVFVSTNSLESFNSREEKFSRGKISLVDMVSLVCVGFFLSTTGLERCLSFPKDFLFDGGSVRFSFPAECTLFLPCREENSGADPPAP